MSAATRRELLPSACSYLRETGRDCILSPDCDGFLCGLYMSHYLNWRIRGYYDGKVLMVEKSIDPAKCVFLDMEICRPHVQSVGQHMLYYNVERKPQADLEKGFALCLSPNNLRRFDFCNQFMQKYPLATIHLLMTLSPRPVKHYEGDFAPLFYVDGVFKNLLNYPENCLDWLNFLDAEHTPLGKLFCGDYPFARLMRVMKEFFLLLDGMTGPNRRPDKLPLPGNGIFSDAQRQQSESFIQAMGDLTKWHYRPEKWTWSNYTSHALVKESITPGLARFQELMTQRPLSWAITSRGSIEYTLDPDGVMS